MKNKVQAKSAGICNKTANGRKMLRDKPIRVHPEDASVALQSQKDKVLLCEKLPQVPEHVPNGNANALYRPLEEVRLRRPIGVFHLRVLDSRHGVGGDHQLASDRNLARLYIDHDFPEWDHGADNEADFCLVIGPVCIDGLYQTLCPEKHYRAHNSHQDASCPDADLQPPWYWCNWIPEYSIGVVHRIGEAEPSQAVGSKSISVMVWCLKQQDDSLLCDLALQLSQSFWSSPAELERRFVWCW